MALFESNPAQVQVVGGSERHLFVHASVSLACSTDVPRPMLYFKVCYRNNDSVVELDALHASLVGIVSIPGHKDVIILEDHQARFWAGHYCMHRRVGVLMRVEHPMQCKPSELVCLRLELLSPKQVADLKLQQSRL